MDQIQNRIANELLALAKKLQPSISTDGRNLKITPTSGKPIDVKMLRSSPIQSQTARFR